MDAKSVIKVGIVVVVALALFGGLYLYLAHINPNDYNVQVAFRDTKGLLRQSVVRMEGVAVGEVKDIHIDTTRRPPQPIVTLSIDKKYDIPADSTCHIVSGLFITNPQVEINPGKAVAALPKNGKASMPSTEGGGALESMAPGVGETITKVNRTLDTVTVRFNQLTAKMNETLDKTNRLLTTTNQAALIARNLVADPRLKTDLMATLANFRDTSADARVTVHQFGAELKQTLRTGNGAVQKLSDHLVNYTLPRLDTTIDEANSVVRKLTDEVTDPRLQQSIQQTAELARTTMARFSQIASDIHQITGDPTLQTNMKQTVAHLDTVTAEAGSTLDKVNALLDRLNGTGKKPRFPAVAVIGSAAEQMNPGHLRVDLDARIGNLVDLGFYDLGQDTRLNLQAISPLGKDADVRYGLYASKLGVGLDYGFGRAVGFRADLYDTNRPRLDFRTLFKVNKDASLWVGGESLGRDPYPVVGVQFQH